MYEAGIRIFQRHNLLTLVRVQISKAIVWVWPFAKSSSTPQSCPLLYFPLSFKGLLRPQHLQQQAGLCISFCLVILFGPLD